MAERRRTTDSLEARRKTGSNEVLDRLFVYATLRDGQTARSLIANQIARCVEASTTGAIYAFPVGYAGFVEAPPPRRVIGEVLWLTDLAATFGLLDAYEGEDFARVIRQVELSTGEPVWTWIYVLADPDTAKHGTLIEHGDWARYGREQDARS
jgi:gamma-glutamylcyclotransferase (GGCT)/AIG2-like uncharacterized protein YtfP